ncbi:formimidoylglutamate deiminase [Sphingomonas sp. BT-65]|uniref:formimidoylglutamate deiminase n=1 Tax=Sphingomonas sp. BT-65 TaxID=2989821 RepID=UPI0022358E93|nr:formimidoylglutamate deiminase [Sphingomonas sp. BT-65]MCW4460122.1 formimidoylglutamate deiminase [Sphingomonas sp. BT-65]
MDLWFESALLEDGWADRVRLRLAGGRVEAIEAGVDPAAGDERHFVALPGLPNLHSHAFQRAMAGLTEARGRADDDFWSWRELMYRFVGRIGPEECEAVAALAYAEMLEAGFTRVGEFHYLHHAPDGSRYDDVAEMSGRIAAAAETAGIGLTLLPVFYAHGGFGGQPAGKAQAGFLNDVDGFAELVERASVKLAKDGVIGIAPHSLRAVTPEALRELLPVAEGGPVHIHIAEQVKEVADCLAWSGRRPVRWLLDEMPVDARWTLVHATHVEPDEVAGIAASGAVAGLCPITEANLGDGLFPAAEFMAQGGMIGVGSDSNVRIDAAEELRLLEYGQRLTRRARNVLAGEERPATGARLFEAAVKGGGRSLGVETGLAAGRPADIVSLDRDEPAFAERGGDALIDSWVFVSHRAVDCVWRGGVKQVAGGRHRQRDTIEARYRTALARLLA